VTGSNSQSASSRISEASSDAEVELKIDEGGMIAFSCIEAVSFAKVAAFSASAMAESEGGSGRCREEASGRETGGGIGLAPFMAEDEVAAAIRAISANLSFGVE